MKTSSKQQEQGLHQQAQIYLQLLRRSIWTIGFWTLLLTAAAAVAIIFLPDQYKATTTILVDPQQIPDRYVASTVTSDPSEKLNTITQQVLSETRLSDIINEVNLYSEMRGRPHEEVIDLMRRHISIQVKESSGQGLSSFTITYQGTSPKVVADVANRLAASFIDWNLKTRQQRAEQTTQFLANQLEEAKHALQEQEHKLRVFKMQHLGEMPDQMAANLQALSRLQVSMQSHTDSLNRLEQERQLLIRLPEQSAAAPAAQLSKRAVLEQQHHQLSNDLWDLKKKYTDSHPDVVAAKARLKELQQQLKALPPETTETQAKENSSTAVRLDLLEHEKQHTIQEQRRIQAQFDAYQSKVDAVPLREQQLSDLTRDYEISKEHYQSLLEKTLSAEMATELEHKQEGERFTIMDPARSPDRPYRPNRPLLMAGSFAGSLFMVIALLVFKESLSGAVRSEHELQEILSPSVLILGSIPLIDTKSDRRHRLRLHLGAIAISMAACLAVVVILWKVHPIL